MFRRSSDTPRAWSGFERPAAACGVAVLAVLLLPIAAVAVRVLRLERALRLVATVPFPVLGPGPIPPTAMASLVDAVTTRLGGACLARAVVLHAALAKAGQSSVVVIGGRRDGGVLRAHAWVEQHGRLLSVGGAHGYLPLCRIGTDGVTRSAPA